MSEKTTTIAVRVPAAVATEIEDLAKEGGQRKSDWIRDKVMQALHAAVPETVSGPPEPADREPASDLLQAIEARLEQMETALREQLIMVLTAINEAAKAQRKDLCTLGQLGLDMDGLMEERVEAIRDEVLDGIERLKASQRSHKETLLQAIGQRRTPSRGY